MPHWAAPISCVERKMGCISVLCGYADVWKNWAARVDWIFQDHSCVVRMRHEGELGRRPNASTAIIGSLEKWAAFSKTTQLEQVLFN